MQLTVWDPNRISETPISQEGVTQGYPLAMVERALGILPLIIQLKEAFQDAHQTRYSDNAASGRLFEHYSFWERLYYLGPDRG